MAPDERRDSRGVPDRDRGGSRTRTREQHIRCALPGRGLRPTGRPRRWTWRAAGTSRTVQTTTCTPPAIPVGPQSCVNAPASERTTIQVPGGGWVKQGFSDVSEAIYSRMIDIPDIRSPQVDQAGVRRGQPPSDADDPVGAQRSGPDRRHEHHVLDPVGIRPHAVRATGRPLPDQYRRQGPLRTP